MSQVIKHSANFIAAGLVSTCLAAGASHAQVTSSLTVSGSVATPTTFTGDALAALPQATQTDSFTSGGTPFTDNFSGSALYSVLQAAGGITVDPTVKNDLLTKYVITTGSDGYEAVISAGEIAPKFGNKADLIATSDTGGTFPAAGFARVTAPGDVAGGRYVSNLTSVVVGSAPLQPGTVAGPTTSLVLQGAVATAMTLTASSLEAMANTVTETVTYTSGTTLVTDTYTGVLLWSVLDDAGILTDPTIKNDILRKLVTVAGSDGYNVDLSLGEIDPAFGDEPILLAYSDTAGQIGGGAGFARLIVPGDVAGGRYVSNVASLTVFDPTVTAVPEPAGLTVLLTAVAALRLLRRRA